MKRVKTNFSERWFPEIVLASALLLSGCASGPTVTVIPADREIRALPNGNYEVPPAWLQERFEIERRLLKALDECPRYGPTQ